MAVPRFSCTGVAAFFKVIWFERVFTLFWCALLQDSSSYRWIVRAKCPLEDFRWQGESRCYEEHCRTSYPRLPDATRRQFNTYVATQGIAMRSSMRMDKFRDVTDSANEVGNPSSIDLWKVL